MGAPHLRPRPPAPPAPKSRSMLPLSPSIAAYTDRARKVYGRGDTEVVALDDVSVQFESSYFTAIMGPSGSGKSTLMHCIAGLDDLTSGRAVIGDTDLSTLDEKRLTQLRRDRICFVFQTFNLVPTLTALENMTLPMDLAGRKPDKEWLHHVIATPGPLDPVS